jgi:hypothetical protein
LPGSVDHFEAARYLLGRPGRGKKAGATQRFSALATDLFSCVEQASLSPPPSCCIRQARTSSGGPFTSLQNFSRSLAQGLTAGILSNHELVFCTSGSAWLIASLLLGRSHSLPLTVLRTCNDCRCGSW